MWKKLKKCRYHCYDFFIFKNNITAKFYPIKDQDLNPAIKLNTDSYGSRSATLFVDQNFWFGGWWTLNKVGFSIRIRIWIQQLSWYGSATFFTALICWFAGWWTRRTGETTSNTWGLWRSWASLPSQTASSVSSLRYRTSLKQYLCRHSNIKK